MNAPLAQRRLARARQHLKAARDLLAHDDLADAVSRAYYAIFQAARALLATRDLDSRKHSGIIALFNRHFVKSREVDRRFGVILKEARRAREQADYDELSEFTVEDVRAQIRDADEFCAAMEATIAARPARQ